MLNSQSIEHMSNWAQIQIAVMRHILLSIEHLIAPDGITASISSHGVPNYGIVHWCSPVALINE